MVRPQWSVRDQDKGKVKPWSETRPRREWVGTGKVPQERHGWSGAAVNGASFRGQKGLPGEPMASSAGVSAHWG